MLNYIRRLFTRRKLDALYLDCERLEAAVKRIKRNHGKTSDLQAMLTATRTETLKFEARL
jgi:hypothetical protein